MFRHASGYTDALTVRVCCVGFEVHEERLVAEAAHHGERLDQALVCAQRHHAQVLQGTSPVPCHQCCVTVTLYHIDHIVVYLCADQSVNGWNRVRHCERLVTCRIREQKSCQSLMASSI